MSVGVIRLLTHCQQFTFSFNYCITLVMFSDALCWFPAAHVCASGSRHLIKATKPADTCGECIQIICCE